MKQKMKYSKRLIAAAALIVALGVGAFGVSATLAAENGRGDMTTLVEAIAEKFDVKVADVQAVFDEHRAEMEAAREVHEAEMLDKAVENGKLSQEQADLILEKRAEMKLFAEGLKELSEEDRREVMKTQMEEVKAWAEENDIPLHLLLPGGRGGHHRPTDGPMMGRHMMDQQAEQE